MGRATALLFAQRGASLALAARGRDALEEAAAECRAAGGTAIVVPTDVRDPEAVRALGNAATSEFGGFDVWVNNAGVIAYGKFEELPDDVFWGLIETNLRGQVNGARVALGRFREHGGGVLINMASVWGRLTSPHVSAYVTSKFAVRAFSECLRQEVADDPNIAIATILPESVDTPIFQHAANFSGHEPRPIPPLIDPREVAEGIVKCAESPEREVTHGRAGHALEAFHYVLPRAWSRLVPHVMRRTALGPQPAPPTRGNVLAATDGLLQVDGGWRARFRTRATARFSRIARGR